MPLLEALIAAKARLSALLLSSGIGNIVGVGVGRARVRGRLTRFPCVRVYVRRKLPLSQVDLSQRVPSFVDGLPTDVIAVGGSIPTFAGHVGASVSHTARAVGHGTVGCYVRDKSDRLYILSCAHVFDPPGKKAKPGDKIHVPAVEHAGPHAATWAERARYVDAAIARVDSQHTPDFAIPGVGRVGARSARRSASLLGVPVVKTGSKTMTTFGVVDDWNFAFLNPLRDNEVSDGNLIVKANGRSNAVFAVPGDSGSLVVLQDGSNRPVGILLGEVRGNCAVTPIGPVCADLKVTIAR